MNYGIVATHGNMGSAMVETVRDIVGDNGSLVSAGFHRGDDIDGFRAELMDIIAEHPDDDIFIFTDLFGGSCANTAMKLLSQHTASPFFRGKLYGFAGANLSMLIAFSAGSKILPGERLRDIITDESRRSIIDMGKALAKRGVK